MIRLRERVVPVEDGVHDGGLAAARTREVGAARGESDGGRRGGAGDAEAAVRARVEEGVAVELEDRGGGWVRRQGCAAVQVVDVLRDDRGEESPTGERRDRGVRQRGHRELERRGGRGLRPRGPAAALAGPDAVGSSEVREARGDGDAGAGVEDGGGCGGGEEEVREEAGLGAEGGGGVAERGEVEAALEGVFGEVVGVGRGHVVRPDAAGRPRGFEDGGCCWT
mmetsp:Transcript_1316/g.3607  ORF Transcript_1316/g.3607 Transcript_1316/m.3607 type:complete len:224 (+) Transcript_1316:168-839(+)